MPGRGPDHATARRLERRVVELEHRLERLAVLHRAVQSAAAATSVDQVLWDLARELGAALPRVGEICVVEWDRRRGLVRDVLDYRPHSGRRVPIPANATYLLSGLPELHELLRSGRGHLQSIVNDPQIHPTQFAYMHPWKWRVLLQLPLVSGGRTMGAIELVDSRSYAPFAPDEIEFCETMAAQAALALQSAHLFERVRHLADHDALTGLANTRTFRRQVGTALRAARRRGHRGSVLVLDIDDFKRLNDAHGHAHGDRVLRRAAGTLRRQARQGDIAGRLGGDELALLLARADHAEAAEVAARLMDAFSRAGVGISVGVAGFPELHRTADSVIEAADHALLAAKAAGKRRIQLAA
jgi:diguanylate cyclase (GGDEF)-like protein